MSGEETPEPSNSAFPGSFPRYHPQGVRVRCCSIWTLRGAENQITRPGLAHLGGSAVYIYLKENNEMNKQENIEAAREHYNTRKDRRPKQVWDAEKWEWVKL
jgi:hypothetical protein